MSQAHVSSSPLSADFPDSGGALLMDGEFFFDLDSFEQCVAEFKLDSLRLVGSTASAAAGEFGYASSGGANVGMEVNDASSVCVTTDQSQKQESAICSQHGAYNRHAATTPDRHSTRSSKRSKTQDTVTEQVISPTPKVPKKRNQNRSRKRQREELEQLRTSVMGLEIQLEMLLNGYSALAAGASPADADDEMCSSRRKRDLQLFVREALAWKHAASAEKLLSEYAAVENAKLRALIEETVLICKNFEEACSKSCITSMQHADSIFTPMRPLASHARSDAVRFDALRQNLDAQYERMRSVWDECNFTSSSAETKQLNQLKRDGNQFYFEHSKAHIYPFSPDAVNRTMWTIAKGGLFTPNNGELKIRRAVGNTLFATLVDRISLSDTQKEEATVRVWITLKRFIDDHQIAVVWQAEVEIEHTHSRARLLENGWYVMRSLSHIHGEKSPGLTSKVPCISQTCIRTTPDKNCVIREDELAIGSVTANILVQYYQNMSMINQAIENVLLDESLA